MTASDTIEPAIRHWFQEEWQRLDSSATTATDDLAECCPVTWLMPELLQLIVRTHAQPVAEVRYAIRLLILEHDFNDMAGDAVFDAHHREVVDRYVNLLTRTVERVRRRANESGQWSDVPAPSQFFG